MRLDLTPRRVAAVAGSPTTVIVTITNTGDVISGYAIRCLGVDPAWVQVDHPEPTLFPSETAAVTITLDLPAALPAGERRMAVQVRELTGPGRTAVEELVVDMANGSAKPSPDGTVGDRAVGGEPGAGHPAVPALDHAPAEQGHQTRGAQSTPTT